MRFIPTRPCSHDFMTQPSLYMMSWEEITHDVDGCNRHSGAKLTQVEPSSGQVRAELKPSWAKLSQVRAKLEPSWSQVEPSWAKLGRKIEIWCPGTKWAPGGPRRASGHQNQDLVPRGWKWSPEGPRRAPGDENRDLLPRGWKWAPEGPRRAPEGCRRAQVHPSQPQLSPSWAQVGTKLSQVELSWFQVGAKLRRSWSTLGQAKKTCRMYSTG